MTLRRQQPGSTADICDYHVHTAFCKHAVGTVSEYITKAAELGLKEICFTDHMPLPDHLDGCSRMAMSEVNQYFETIDTARSQNLEIEVLRRIVGAGIPLTLGSDAHAPEHVGFELERLQRQALSLPGAKLARFRQRERTIMQETSLPPSTEHLAIRR